jgi:hypothetical protein
VGVDVEVGVWRRHRSTVGREINPGPSVNPGPSAGVTFAMGAAALPMAVRGMRAADAPESFIK